MDPAALRNKPDLSLTLQHYMRAFYLLSARRPVNEVEGAIPVSEIVAYLMIYPWYDNDLFVRYIIGLDSAYLGHRKELNDNKNIDFRGKS